MAQSNIGEIVAYRKVAIIEGGVLRSMRWEHPSGNQEIDLADCIDAWHYSDPTADYQSVEFLHRKAFVVRMDGREVEPQRRRRV